MNGGYTETAYKDVFTDLSCVLLMSTLVTVGSSVSWQAVALSGHMVAAVSLAAGRARLAALVAIHASSAFWEKNGIKRERRHVLQSSTNFAEP